MADDEIGRLLALNGGGAGTERERAELRALLDKYPTTAEKAGQLARHVERNLLAAWGNPLVLEATARVCERMRRQMGYEAAPELERLLIDRVVACWLHVQWAEYQRQLTWGGPSLSHDSADFWGRELARANASFLKAAKVLAQVRRLLQPVVQVNIAERQVNLAAQVADGRHAPSPARNESADPSRGGST